MRRDDNKKRPAKKSRKQAEQESLLWYFECMDRVNRAMQGTNDLEQAMKDVLDTLLAVFGCDRAWLVYPCDPEAAAWQVPMERTTPEYPGILPIGVELPLEPAGAEVYRILRNSPGPVTFGPESEHPVPLEIAGAFNVQSFIAMAVYPKIGKPWSFGLHQCSYARAWTPKEARLFQEIGRRLSDTLSTLLAYRNLQENEAQIRQLVDFSPVAMAVTSRVEGRAELVNDKFIELFGYTVEDVPDVAHWWPVAYPDETYREEVRSEWEARVERAFQNKTPFEPLEATVLCKDGSRRHVEFCLSSIGEKQLVTFVDLTDRKRAEDALRERERHSQSLLRLSRKLEQAQTYSEVLHAAQDEVREIIGYQNLWAYLFTPDKKQAKALMAKGPMSEKVMSEDGTGTITIQGDRMMEELLETTEIMVVEDAQIDERTDKKIAAKMGNRTLVHVPILLFDRHMGSVGMGTFEDEGVRIPSASEREYLIALASHMAVTLDRIHLLDTRKQSEQLFRALVENSPDFIARYDRECRRIYVNPAIQKLFGTPPEDMLGKTPADQSPVYTPQLFMDHLKRVIETGTESVTEMPYRTAAGEMHWSHMRFVPEFGPDGKVDSVLHIGRDIHEIKENERRFRMLAENFPDFVVRFDRDGRYLYVNPAFGKLFGAPAESIIGKTLQDLPSRGKLGQYDESLALIRRALDEGIASESEVRWDTERGERIFDTRYVPERDATGNVVTVLCIARDVTEQKRAEEELQKTNDLLRAIIEAAPTAIIGLDLEGKVQNVWNPAAEKMLGWSAREAMGNYLPSVPIDKEDEFRKFRDWIRSGKGMDGVEVQRRRRDGTPIDYSIYASPLHDTQGQIAGNIAVLVDITERKRAEEQRKNHLRFLESMDKVNKAMQGTNNLDQIMNNVLDTVLSVFNCDRAFLVYPCDPDAPSWGARAESTRPEYPGLLASGINEVPIDGEAAEMFRIMLNADGPVTFGTGNQYPMPRDSFERFELKSFMSMAFYPKIGKPWHFGIHQCSYARIWTSEEERLFHEIGRRLSDVLTVLLTYRHLQESEERYRQLVNLSPDGILIYRDGQVQFVNPAMVHMSGATSADQLIGKSVLDGIHPDSRGIAQKRIHEMESTGRPIPFIEEKLLRLDGTSFPVEIAAVPYSLNNTQYVQIVVRDITERKRAEEALRESEERLRQIASALREVVWLRDVQTRQVLYVNPAFQGLTGRTCESFYENRDIMIDAIHPDDKEWVMKALDQRFESVPFDREHRIIHLNGSVRWVSSRIFPVQNEAGEVYRWASIMEDITERKHHELEREAIIIVSTALRKATTRVEILTVLLDQLAELFDADGSMIAFPNPENGDILVEMGRGALGERFSGLNIPRGKGVSGWVIANKKPYLNNNAHLDPLFYRPDLLGDSACVASVPLIAREQAMGALWIARHTTIVDQELRLLTAIADIAANALHRVMLHEQTVQQLRHLLALHQIDLAISANFDLTVTLKVILQNVRDELEVDAASILLLDPVTHTLDYAAGTGFRTHSIEGSHVKLGHGYAGRAVQEHRTMSAPDLNRAPGTFSRSSLLAYEGFLSHCATPLVVKGQVKGVLEIFHRKTFVFDKEWISYFETLATQAAIAIENASLVENLQRSNMELILAYDATIEGWSRALDLRDRETEGHTQRVTEMVLELAEKIGMSDAEKLDLRRGALLHDIGKMGVPDSILLKPGSLTESDWEIMRQHPLYAFQMLSPISYLKHALDVPYCHHEKWDSTGYPRGLKGEAIPLAARLFAIVDVFDALTSNRPYSPAWPLEEVYRYIQEQAGRHFDPSIVKIFLEGK
jgi:PAS domain S-box-containing protein